MGDGRKKDFHRMIGDRIRVAREAADLTQRQLSDRLGFRDRQTLSAIETGERRVTSEELLGVIRVLAKDLDFFTDPFRLVGEGAFSWRAQAGPAELESFEEKARGWIAAYRALGEDLDETFNPLAPRLGLTIRSLFEEAWDAAERLNRAWELGARPAATLPRVAEEKLDILVLHVDMEGLPISGAACHLPEFDTILINRRDHEGRRAFDFAHELFHILTWPTMPPDRLDTESPAGYKAKRTELLANNFAGALLMPGGAIIDRWNQRGRTEIHNWIKRTAAEFRVTALALYNRLRALDLIPAAEHASITEARLTWTGRVPPVGSLPPLFSAKYMRRVRKALDRGFLSERRAASLLGLSLEEMGSLMETYGLAPEPVQAAGDGA
ncbi:MAG: XRE family transcriptional regulator [Deltaproteobacteria bacterium]|nr:XRE family transcriptional regulator [Deltaproteobacteria bacterium]